MYWTTSTENKNMKQTSGWPLSDFRYLQGAKTIENNQKDRGHVFIVAKTTLNNKPVLWRLCLVCQHRKVHYKVILLSFGDTMLFLLCMNILLFFNRQYPDEIPHMKVFVILIQLLILLTNIPMLISTLKHSLTMLDSLLVVSCVNRWASEIKGAVSGEFKIRKNF
jgi:hypothetical protein